MRLYRLHHFQFWLGSILYAYAIPRLAGFRIIPSMKSPIKSKIMTRGDPFASKQHSNNTLNIKKSSNSTSVEKKSSSLKKAFVRGILIVVIMVIESYIYILYIFLYIFGPIADFLNSIM